jgi:predicted small secreted protein
MIRKLLILVPLLAAMLIAAGCNTTRGFGEDMEALGQYIQESTE